MNIGNYKTVFVLEVYVLYAVIHCHSQEQYGVGLNVIILVDVTILQYKIMLYVGQIITVSLSYHQPGSQWSYLDRDHTQAFADGE